MCGICGIVSLTSEPSIDIEILQKIPNVLQHRGPDGNGIWIDDSKKVGFGHQRLAIVDLSDAGQQPMATPDGMVQVTFNGEIYNFQELRSDLEKEGYRFRSRTDTEVLLYLYEMYGEGMVDRLDGDFGFGLWDGRRRKLLLARDRAGVKPVYYTRVSDQLLFASEIKSLLQHPDVSREMDEESFYHYLTYLVVPSPKTLVKGIYKLPTAGLLTLEYADRNASVNIQQYWEPFPGKMQVDKNDLDGQFESLLRKSVEKRMMSDVPVGVLFSGGVDSTLNTVLFQKAVKPDPVKTYNVGIKETNRHQDESHWARRMATQLGTEHHEIEITQDDLLDTVTALAEFQDEPLADPVCVPLYFVTKLARETGTVVLQAGEGADELFCGYDNYRRFLRHNRNYWKPLSRMPSFINQIGFRILQRSTAPRNQKMADALRRLIHHQEFFMSSAVAYYEGEKQSVISTDFKNRFASYDSYDIVAPLYERIAAQNPDASFLEKMTFIELQLRLPELLLMRVDKMSMANSVEVRVPFLDRDLVDFALSVPESFKLRDRVSKEPVKRLAARYVSHGQIYKPKKGFGAPIQEWFHGRVGDHMRSLLEEDRVELEAFFDVPHIKRSLDNSLSTVNQAFQLWVIYNLIIWRRAMCSNGGTNI